MTDRSYEESEQRRVLELASDYRSKGYRVIVSPLLGDVPPVLQKAGYSPDLLAFSDEETLVVEVASRKSSEKLARIAGIADIVNDIPGWRFVLVMTESRYDEESTAIPVLDLSELQGPLDATLALRDLSYGANGRFNHAVLLVSWAVIEAALRMYLETGHKREPRQRSSLSLVRDSVMLGFLTPEDGEFLREAGIKRNQIAHGAFGIVVEAEFLERLLSIAVSVARDVGSVAQDGSPDGDD